jgi:hypothetical protein
MNDIQNKETYQALDNLYANVSEILANARKRAYSIDFGKGFDESNLRYMRLFYRCFPKRDTLRHELSWSHYRRLISGMRFIKMKMTIRRWESSFVLKRVKPS